MFLFAANTMLAGDSFAGYFLRFSTSAKASAMGKAGIATIEDPSAIYWNPANLRQIDTKQLLLLHSQYFISDINYDFASFVYPGEDHTFGIGFSRLAVDNIVDSRKAQIITNNGDWYLDYSKLSYFSTADYAFYFSYARDWSEEFHYAITAKLIYRDFSSQSAYGIGFDAGVDYRPTENLILGGIIQDITTTPIFYSTDHSEYTLPRIRLGAAYNLLVESFDMRFTPTLQIDMYLEAVPDAMIENDYLSLESPFGLEIAYHERIFARVGLDENERMTLGAGLMLGGFSMDYAFTSYADELGNINVIAVNIDFLKLFGF